ncbi:MAG TPA: methyltransferase domain-containing protein, partial [Stellaceae bacterium]|nr:methyltransferase domain-containing protein [Stellaceae bacterium]
MAARSAANRTVQSAAKLGVKASFARPVGPSPEFFAVDGSKSTQATSYMTWRPCPVCGGERHRPLIEFNDFQFYSDAVVPKRVNIRQVQCRDCLGVFMNPVFTGEGFAVLFAEAGASYGSTPKRVGEQLGWLGERGLLEPKTTLLDIGCYDGSFIGKLPAGVKGIGVDIDEPAIARARQRFADTSHRFIYADFEAVEVSEPVDVITMFHVLEHLPRPVEVLERLAALATPRTRLLVEVPIVENVIYGDICGFLSAHHLTHFSKASLQNVMQRAGWDVLSTQTMEEYNGFRVIAQPVTRKNAQPEPADLHSYTLYLSRWYEAVAEIEKRLQRATTPRCILRGGGLQTEFLFHLTSLFAGDRRFLIADGDPLKQGRTWRGIKIVGPDCLASVDWRETQIVLSSYFHQDVMREEAQVLGIPAQAVISL